MTRLNVTVLQKNLVLPRGIFSTSGAGKVHDRKSHVKCPKPAIPSLEVEADFMSPFHAASI